jgi:hypothetical protein
VSSAPGYKLCPECRGEYTQAVTRCVDCDVDLVSSGALAQVDEEVAAFPPASELDCVRVAPLAWIRALSEALQQGGVAHRIEPAESEDAPEGQRPDVFGDVQLFGLYLRSEDAGPARELDGTIAARLLPEEAPALEHDEEEACPACGSALAADATECPECGLSFA